jgi:dihydroorotase
VELLVDKLAINPREILGVTVPVIAEGERANLVLFDTETEWEYSNKNNCSKSVNSPFFGQQLKGKVQLTYNNKQIFK